MERENNAEPWIYQHMVKPAFGQSVTIRLTGSNTEKDAFENLVELTGKKNPILRKNRIQ